MRGHHRGELTKITYRRQPEQPGHDRLHRIEGGSEPRRVWPAEKDDTIGNRLSGLFDQATLANPRWAGNQRNVGNLVVGQDLKQLAAKAAPTASATGTSMLTDFAERLASALSKKGRPE